ATPVPGTATPGAGASATATPQPIGSAGAAAFTPTAPPTAGLTPTPESPAAPEVDVDLRLWNGDAVLQVDGRTVSPGKLTLPRGPHQAAALVDDSPVAIMDLPADGGRVDLYVPPPLASLA